MDMTQILTLWAAFSVPLIIGLTIFLGLSRKLTQAEKKKMQKEIERLQQLAYKDELTGLLTRRTFEEELEPHLREIVVARDRKVKERTSPTQCVTLAVIDIDRFKNVNDTLGHRAGDHVLQEVANHIKRHVRATNFLARWGGEEFVVAFLNVGMEGALRFAERLRKNMEEAVFTWNNLTLRLTISVGVATFGEGMKNLQDLFEEADKELYKAKYAGRNRVSGQVEVPRK